MIMDKVKSQNAADEINVIIEIPMNHDPVKYEFDKESGAILVDRFIQTPMFYPCNYGFVPHTLSGDGDPVDVLVISNYPLLSGSIIRARPIGVLFMEDESGMDEKILAVPITKLDPSFENIKTVADLNLQLRNKIVHFFSHYKDLEPGKWVKIQGFKDVDIAWQIINKSLVSPLL